MPAKEMALEVKQGDWLSKSSDEGLFAYQAVKEAAFNAELRSQGLNSDVIELAPDRYVVIHIEEHKAPQVQDLENVRNDIQSILSENKAESAALSKAEELQLALSSGERVEDVAKKHDLKWNAIVDGKRSDIAVEAAIRNQAFAMPRPEASASISTLRKSNGDRAVVQLFDVRYGNLAALNADLVQEAEKSAYRNKSSQEFSAYFNSLWESAEIKIN
jgi:peptidyl-prolyl cis-trans isomerase D